MMFMIPRTRTHVRAVCAPLACIRPLQLGPCEDYAGLRGHVKLLAADCHRVRRLRKHVRRSLRDHAGAESRGLTRHIHRVPSRFVSPHPLGIPCRFATPVSHAARLSASHTRADITESMMRFCHSCAPQDLGFCSTKRDGVLGSHGARLCLSQVGFSTSCVLNLPLLTTCILAVTVLATGGAMAGGVGRCLPLAI